VKEFLGIADIDDSAALDVEEIEISRKRALQMKQACFPSGCRASAQRHRSHDPGRCGDLVI
jgi:hypothetical protein